MEPFLTAAPRVVLPNGDVELLYNFPTLAALSTPNIRRARRVYSVVHRVSNERPSQSIHASDPEYGIPRTKAGLVSLKLIGRCSRGIIPFLALPNLQTLQLCGLSALPDDAVPLPLISSSSLHTFVLDRDTHMVTLPWLRIMEHLTSLELGYPFWAYKEDFFRALDRAHEPRFPPKLENFTLSNCQTLEVSQRLLDALISRCGPAAEGLASLKSFYVSDTHRLRSQPLLFQSITTI
ncbi:hypothetical protein C8J57DRAFT_357509 [Mycena rebaudengoi]|nr:hypothetical protein C8J57DRAFT_357509 [Mycena rebaudengoi]